MNYDGSRQVALVRRRTLGVEECLNRTFRQRGHRIASRRSYTPRADCRGLDRLLSESFGRLRTSSEFPHKVLVGPATEAGGRHCNEYPGIRARARDRHRPIFSLLRSKKLSIQAARGDHPLWHPTRMTYSLARSAAACRLLSGHPRGRAQATDPTQLRYQPKAKCFCFLNQSWVSSENEANASERP